MLGASCQLCVSDMSSVTGMISFALCSAQSCQSLIYWYVCTPCFNSFCFVVLECRFGGYYGAYESTCLICQGSRFFGLKNLFQFMKVSSQVCCWLLLLVLQAVFCKLHYSVALFGSYLPGSSGTFLSSDFWFGLCMCKQCCSLSWSRWNLWPITSDVACLSSVLLTPKLLKNEFFLYCPFSHIRPDVLLKFVHRFLCGMRIDEKILSAICIDEDAWEWCHCYYVLPW